MDVNNVTKYLKFANVQMAAESLFALGTPSGIGVSAQAGTGSMDSATLTLGNTRASKFTSILATQFLDNWDVVEHLANTGTGFSGTLFRAKPTAAASLGITFGELVLSFRSTEFADDSARDRHQGSESNCFARCPHE